MWDNLQLFLGIVLIPSALIAVGAGIVITALIIMIHAVTLTVEAESP